MNGHRCTCMPKRFYLRFKCFRLFLLLCHSVIYGTSAASSHRFSLSRRVMKLSVADRCNLTHHKQMRQQEHLKMTQFSQMPQLQKYPSCKMFLYQTYTHFDDSGETPVQGAWMFGELSAGLQRCLTTGRSSGGLSGYCQTENFFLKHFL